MFHDFILNFNILEYLIEVLFLILLLLIFGTGLLDRIPSFFLKTHLQPTAFVLLGNSPSLMSGSYIVTQSPQS